jgi:hypothetical protein
MNKDGPNGSPYGTLAKHDQSETKRDIADGFTKLLLRALLLQHDRDMGLSA